MSMSTANRRASAIGVTLAIRLVLPIPDGTIDASDRQQVAYSYAGIGANAPILGPVEIIDVDAPFRRTTMTAVTIRRAVGLQLHFHRHIDFEVER